MSLNGPLRTDPRCMLHHRGVIRISRIVLGTQHQPRNFVPRIGRLPTHVWPVSGVRVTVYIVTFVNPEVFTEERIHVHLPLTNTRGSFVHAIRITEVIVPDHIPVSRRPGRMSGMPRFRRYAVETITLLPQEVLSRSNSGPRLLDV